MNINRLTEEISEKYGIGKNEIFSNSRRKYAMTARKIIYKVLLLSGKSSTQIGMLLNRDHSTVVVGAKSIEQDTELNEYATYLYLKYRDTEEISPQVDVKLAKKVIFDEVKECMNKGLSLKQISSKIELSENIISNMMNQIKKECQVKKKPDYRTGTYRDIYI